MKISTCVFLMLLFTSCKNNLPNNYDAEIIDFQKELNAEYQNPKTTPLRAENFTKFKKHPFFPINLKYKVLADFFQTTDAVIFELPTSSGKTKKYKEFGKAKFRIDGKELQLTLYQSIDLMKQKKYKNHLFLPFRDLTNGFETYGGGKYLDLQIPNGNKIQIDFNKSYHPYCAYNAIDYNCPIVPAENILPIRIEAGVMYEDVYYH